LSANVQRPQSEEALSSSPCGLVDFSQTVEVLTLSDLPVGARLVLRCRKDWRDATVAAVSAEMVTLSVGSPGGHTYRVRRPADSLLALDGSIPLLGEGSGWRAGRVRYDLRW